MDVPKRFMRVKNDLLTYTGSVNLWPFRTNRTFDRVWKNKKKWKSNNEEVTNC